MKTQKAIKNLLSVLLLILLCNSTKSQTITDITSKQEDNNIVVSYIIDGGSIQQVYDVSLYYSVDGGKNYKKCKSISGDTYHIPVGKNAKIIWDVTKDLDYFVSDNIIFRMNACGYWYIYGFNWNPKTVTIGSVTWMTQNLDIDVGKESFYYNNDPKNGTKYGRLYSWEAARIAEKRVLGWRIPYKEECQQLINIFRDREERLDYTAYTNLIEGGSSNFNAVLGGHYFNYSRQMGAAGTYLCWSRSPDSFGGNKFYFCFIGGKYKYVILRSYDVRELPYSVRLVKD